MRARGNRIPLLALAALGLVGCSPEVEGAPAPDCTDNAGCPTGSRCVDGVRCERIDPIEGMDASQRLPTLVGPGPVRGSSAPGPISGTPSNPPFLDASLPPPGADAAAGPPVGPCPGDQRLCDGTCADVLTDSLNCGTCGVACQPGEECRLGRCCGVFDTVCDGQCVDLENDPRNCGVCGLDCGSGFACQLGGCVPASSG